MTFYCGINPELSAYDDSLPKMVCAYLNCRGSLSHQINTGLARRLTSQPTWATRHRARTTQLDCESVSSVYKILIKHISREQELSSRIYCVTQSIKFTMCKNNSQYSGQGSYLIPHPQMDSNLICCESLAVQTSTNYYGPARIMIIY